MQSDNLCRLLVFMDHFQGSETYTLLGIACKLIGAEYQYTEDTLGKQDVLNNWMQASLSLNEKDEFISVSKKTG